MFLAAALALVASAAFGILATQRNRLSFSNRCVFGRLDPRASG